MWVGGVDGRCAWEVCIGGVYGRFALSACTRIVRFTHHSAALRKGIDVRLQREYELIGVAFARGLGRAGLLLLHSACTPKYSYYYVPLRCATTTHLCTYYHVPMHLLPRTSAAYYNCVAQANLLALRSSQSYYRPNMQRTPRVSVAWGS